LKAGLCPAPASSGPVCPGIALLLAHCLAARLLPPAYALGDGAKPPENRQNLPVDTLGSVWHDGAAMNESENQFSFTRAALSTCGRGRKQFLIRQMKASLSGKLFLCGAALSIAILGDTGAQAQSAVWTNRYNGPDNDVDSATAIAVDGTGNVFVTGYSYASGGVNPYYATVAYSSGGLPLWTNRYGAPNTSSLAYAVVVDATGNVIVTGQFGADYATISYSSAGVPLWTNRYDGPGNGTDYPTGLAADRSGNVVVTGASVGSGGLYGYATIKYSGAGAPLWTNRYHNGTAGTSLASAVAVDASDNVFVTGRSQPSNFVYPDYVTIKYSSAGVPLWTNRYNGPGNANDLATAIVVDGSGNVIVTGQSQGVGTSYDYATIKYSGAGVPLWTNRYNGPPGNNQDVAHGVAVDGSNNVFVTGGSVSISGYPDFDYATIAYSSAGVALWTNRYNGPGNNDDTAMAVGVDGSGNVFVTGWSGGSSGSDYATVAYSGAGVPLWTNRYNGPANSGDTAAALAVDGSGNVVVTGSSYPDYATIKYSTSTRLPSLTIAYTTTNTVAVSWLSPSTGFTLQQNTNVGTSHWTAVGTTPMDDGTTRTVIVDPPVGQGFYRLIRP
jgi:hypothetical protein